MVEFGEKVPHRINRKALTKEYKLDGRWDEVYFMGVKWRTGESWIATSGGICKARAIRRVGGHRRWDAEGLLQVKDVPWDHVQKDADPGEVRVRWLDPSLLPKPVIADDDGPKRRRARLNQEDFYKFGFTNRCLGCQADSPHTEHCRARLENEMRNTTEGQVRLQKAKERLDTEMAEKLKKLTDKAQGERGSGRREGSAPKRPRKDLPCEIGTGSSSSSTAPAASTMDTSVDDSYNRAAPAGESDERDSKKQKPGDESEHMEVSHVERMTQEDYVCSVNDVSDMCEETSDDVQGAVTDMNFYDETTGELFNQRLVRDAEDEELQRFKKMGVCDYVDRQTAHQDGDCFFVKDRWVRVNKGTKTNPHMKCRLVAQESLGTVPGWTSSTQIPQVSVVSS